VGAAVMSFTAKAQRRKRKNLIVYVVIGETVRVVGGAPIV